MRGKWETNLWSSFAEKEDVLRSAGYLIIKYAFKNSTKNDTSENPIFEILRKTEHPEHCFFYFKCNEKKSESFKLMQHIIRQIPYEEFSNITISNQLRSITTRAKKQISQNTSNGQNTIHFRNSIKTIIDALDRMEMAFRKLDQESFMEQEEYYFKNFDPEKVIFQ